jgi:hypothetical protein
MSIAASIDFREEQDAAQDELRRAREAGNFEPFFVRRRGWRWDVQYYWGHIGLTFWRRSTAAAIANELQFAARGQRPVSNQDSRGPEGT